MALPLTQEGLKKWLEYNPETGSFHWIQGQRAGQFAGNQDRYHVICLHGTKYPASKLAWLYMTGEYPVEILDHINCISLDNRWANLRKATHSQNSANRAAAFHNALGVKGVRMMKKRYSASICVRGNKIYLGLFKTIEEASKAYQEATQRYNGEFAKW